MPSPLDHLLSLEFWSVGVAENIRNSVLLSSLPLLGVGLYKLRASNVDALATVIKLLAMAFVVLASFGVSPLFGNVWIDLPVSLSIAGAFYVSTYFGFGLRLIVLSPLAVMVCGAMGVWRLGMPAQEVVAGTVASSSLFVMTSALLSAITILVVTMRYGLPSDDGRSSGIRP
jgi:hypothetical protein